MAIEDQIERLERITPLIPPCRCCGKALSILDGITEAVREGVGIHTRCIPQHWSKHSKHINNARCREFRVEGGLLEPGTYSKDSTVFNYMGCTVEVFLVVGRGDPNYIASGWYWWTYLPGFRSQNAYYLYKDKADAIEGAMAIIAGKSDCWADAQPHICPKCGAKTPCLLEQVREWNCGNGGLCTDCLKENQGIEKGAK